MNREDVAHVKSIDSLEQAVLDTISHEDDIDLVACATVQYEERSDIPGVVFTMKNGGEG